MSCPIMRITVQPASVPGLPLQPHRSRSRLIPERTSQLVRSVGMLDYNPAYRTCRRASSASDVLSAEDDTPCNTTHTTAAAKHPPATTSEQSGASW